MHWIHTATQSQPLATLHNSGVTVPPVYQSIVWQINGNSVMGQHMQNSEMGTSCRKAFINCGLLILVNCMYK